VKIFVAVAIVVLVVASNVEVQVIVAAVLASMAWLLLFENNLLQFVVVANDVLQTVTVVHNVFKVVVDVTNDTTVLKTIVLANNVVLQYNLFFHRDLMLFQIIMCSNKAWCAQKCCYNCCSKAHVAAAAFNVVLKYDVAIVVANFVLPQTLTVVIAHDLLKVVATVTFDSADVIFKELDIWVFHSETTLNILIFVFNWNKVSNNQIHETKLFNLWSNWNFPTEYNWTDSHVNIEPESKIGIINYLPNMMIESEAKVLAVCEWLMNELEMNCEQWMYELITIFSQL
jgi:hypothetical protein